MNNLYSLITLAFTSIVIFENNGARRTMSDLNKKNLGDFGLLIDQGVFLKICWL